MRRRPATLLLPRCLVALLPLLIVAAPASAQISITSISPDAVYAAEAPADGMRQFTVTGSFPSPFPMTARLFKAGQPDIWADNVYWVSPTEITIGDPSDSTGGFDLTGASPGVWDLEVTPLLQDPATLPGALTVTPPRRFNRLGTWGGPVFSAQIVGNLAYLARGSDMVILDVTDPADMVEVSVTDMAEVLPHSEWQGGVVNHVAVQGDYAFVSGDGVRMLTILDVSDPADPQLVVANLEVEPHAATLDVSFYGNIAYARGSSPPGYLYALDVSDPPGLDPEVDVFTFVYLGSFRVQARPVIVGSYLYVAGWDLSTCPDCDPALSIYDLSADPFAPQLVGSTTLYLDSHYFGTGLAVEGGFAYVTFWHNVDGYGGVLETVDVSDPTAPDPTDGFTDLSWPADVAVAGGVAYVADWEWCPWGGGCPRVAKGLAVFDLATSPGYPALVGELLTHGAVRGVALDGTTAYLLDDGEGVIAVDAAVPADPTRLGTYDSPAWIQTLAQEGDLLYVSDFWNGVTAVDVSDPRHPTTVGVHQTASAHTGENGTVAVQDGIAYLAAGYNGVEVVDFADPANPVLIGGFQDPGAIPELTRVSHGLAVKDDVLIAHATQTPLGGTWVLDVFDPANPVLASAPQHSNWDIWALSDDFLAFGLSWLPGIVHDLLDPYNPVTWLAPPPPLQWFGGNAAIVFEGNRFYTLAINFDVGSVNIYDYALSPTREVTISRLATFEIAWPQAMTAANGIAYVDSAGGLLAIDAGDPAAGLPVMAARGIDKGYRHSSMLVDGRYLYVGGYDDANLLPTERLGTGLVTYQLAVHGDADGDADVDLADYAAFQRCFTGPDLEPADPDCAVMDFDEDGDVDLDDLEPLLLAWGQPGIFWASSDQTEFEQYVAAQGLNPTGFEDFEEAVVPGENVSFPPPLDQFTDNGIFSPGDIPAGLTIQHNALEDAAWWPDPSGSTGLMAFAPPWYGATSKGVVQQDDSDASLDLIFDPGVTAVGFDTVTLDTDRSDVQIMIFDTDNNLLRTYLATPGSAAGQFFGVYSIKPIGRINIWTPDVYPTRDWAGADNIQMWAAP